MQSTANATLSDFYAQVMNDGRLRTPEHAQRWTRATLQTLGLDMQRGVKRKLARALPKELADDLNGVFWLLHFRNPNMTALEFQDRTARRAGNTDKLFARMPIIAVFRAVQSLIDSNLKKEISEALAPELRALWQEADRR